MSNKELAKAAVLSTAKKYGYVDESVWERVPADVRREIQESFLAKDELAGHAIQTYALQSPQVDCKILLACMLIDYVQAREEHLRKRR